MALENNGGDKRRGKILVIRGGAIGDFIVTLPVFAALRERFADTRIEVMGYPQIAALANVGRLVDAVIPIESRPLAGFFARNGKLDETVSDQFSEYDVIFSYLFDPDEIFRTNIGRVSPAQIIQGPHRPYETSPMSAAAQFLVPLERLAIFDSDPVPRLPINPPPPRQPRLLAIHPGSGSPAKNWPVHHWQSLIHDLVGQTDFSFLVVGGEAEGDRIDALTRWIPTERLRVERNRPLDQLAPLLAGCKAFIGHDSGITHLAAAVGTPTLALWGPSVEHIWRPGGDHVLVLKANGGLLALEPDAVRDAVMRLMDTP